MWKIKKYTGTTNPFITLVGNLTPEWKTVSLEYLKEVHDTINAASPIVKTYGDAFDILEYLHNAGAVELVPLEGSDSVYKIRKVEYSG